MVCAVIRLLAVTASLGLFGVGTADGRPTPITPACGDTVGPGGSWVLGADVGPCSSREALRVIGPVRLDLNGHELSCDAERDRAGLRVEGFRAILSNGRVENCARGVDVSGGGRHRLKNVVVDRSFNGVGFVLRSDANRVTRCRADSDAAQEDIGIGFTVEGDKNRLRRNVVTSDRRLQIADDGFVILGDLNRLVGNEVVETDGHAYVVTGRKNRLRANVGDWATEVAFAIHGSENRLTENRGRGERAFVLSGEGHRLVQNTGFGSHDEYFAARIEGHGHVLRRNELSGFLGALGAVVVGGTSHVLADNLVIAGTRFGVSIEGQSHTLRGNRAEAQPKLVAGPLGVVPNVGFSIWGDGHSLEENVALGHGLSGFLVSESAFGNELAGNAATGNNVLQDPDHFDLRDDTPECGSNEWRDNRADTRNQSCVR